jgi:hypothetical protein
VSTELTVILDCDNKLDYLFGPDSVGANSSVRTPPPKRCNPNLPHLPLSVLAR